MVLVVRVPAEPSRHRVAVWRELRRAGAILLGQGVWAVPDAPVFANGIARTLALAERGDGDVTVLTAAGRGEPDAARLEALFTAERAEEWAEFIAELEEEEHSLERLRRWHRDLTARDVFGAPSAAEADQQLKHCIERLADYTERVFSALHQM